MHAPPDGVYPTHGIDPLPSLRVLIDQRPEAIYLEAHDLSRLLGCSESEAEEARRWLVEDALEVRA